jgi:hypothetical protein
MQSLGQGVETVHNFVDISAGHSRPPSSAGCLTDLNRRRTPDPHVVEHVAS